MADRMGFTAKLAGILEMAAEQEHHITIEEVEKYFEEDHLNDEQMGLVCEYLMSQKIVVSGYCRKAGVVKENEEKETHSLSQEEQAYVESYLSEISLMPQDTEEAAMLKYYLPKIVEIAIELHQPEIYIGDMIQEGCMGLMMALQKTEMATGIVWEDDEDMTDVEASALTPEAEEEMILSEVRAGIQAMIEEQTETKRRDKKMVNRVSELDEVIQAMNDEYGRKVAIDEVAERLGVTENEIADILKLAGEEVPKEEQEEE